MQLCDVMLVASSSVCKECAVHAVHADDALCAVIAFLGSAMTGGSSRVSTGTQLFKENCSVPSNQYSNLCTRRFI